MARSNHTALVVRNASIAILASFLALAVICQAQEFRGTISGRVVDPQGAVVPNVKITAVCVETGGRYQTVSTADGRYTLPYVAPGHYNIAAEAAGFKRHVTEGVQVSTNEHVGLDIKPELGQLVQTVTVTGGAPLLLTTTASVGQVITQHQVENTPLNGRSAMLLVWLAYGVIPTEPLKQQPSYAEASNFSIGGAPRGQNELLLDGAPDTSRTGSSNGFTPPLDALVEVKVESFQSDAAYGHTGGGTVNMTTKSGTNTFHGVAYEYNEVSRLAATSFFINSSGQKKPVTRYNQWGVATGGPVVLPKVLNGRNKLFWYFSYEGIKTGKPNPNTLTVPTAAERSGDLSGLLSVGANYQLYDPLTAAREGSRVRRQLFPNNIIPPNRVSPIAKKLLDYYGLPNQPGRPDGVNNFLANSVTRIGYDSEMGRLDWNISDRHRAFFSARNGTKPNRQEDWFGNVATGNSAVLQNKGATLDYVGALSPTVVVNSRLHWNHSSELRSSSGDGFDFSTLGFPASLAQQSQRMMFPGITLGSMDSGTKGGLGRGGKGVGGVGVGGVPLDSFQIFPTATIITGRQTLKWGADLRLIRFSAANFGYSSGSYTFGTAWTNGPLDNSTSAPVGQDVAALLLGLPTAGTFAFNATQSVQTGYYALFLQDDFHVRPDLTLNLGLRYERDLPMTERFNRAVNGFDFTTLSPISAAASAAYVRNPTSEIAAGQFRAPGGLLFASPSQRAVYGTSAHNFNPRFGFAWQPSILGQKTVIRGGTGVFFFSFPVDGTAGVNQTGFTQTTSLVPTLDGYLTPNATLSNPFPQGLLQPSGSSLGLATYLGNAVNFTTHNRRNPYSVRWNFNLQRELPARMVVELGYFGNHAVHLENNLNLNYVPRQYLSTSPLRDQPVIDRLTANVANPFAGLIPGTNLNGSTVQRQQLLTAFPQFTGVTQQSVPEGSSYLHAFQARLEKRFSRGLQLLANFYRGKLIERTARLNDSDPSPAKMIGQYDIPYRFAISGSWDVPVGKGKTWLSHSAAWLDRVIGGWNVNFMYSRQPGFPLNWGSVIYYGGDLNVEPHSINGAFDVTRFNRNSREQLASNIRTFPARFSTARADGVNNIDSSVVKRIPVNEKIHLQFRCEFFNLMNHPIFDAPNTNPTNSSFGFITSQTNDPRVIQMALRLVW